MSTTLSLNDIDAKFRFQVYIQNYTPQMKIKDVEFIYFMTEHLN